MNLRTTEQGAEIVAELTASATMDAADRVEVFAEEIAREMEAGDGTAERLRASIFSAWRLVADEPGGEEVVHMVARCGNGDVALEVQGPQDFRRTLQTDARDRHSGYGIPALVSVSDEVVIRRKPEGTQIQVIVHV